jgi:hypothetical protein
LPSLDGHPSSETKLGSRETPVAGELGRERSLKRRQQFGGLNTPRLTPGWTLSEPVGHCSDQLDFVWLGLFVQIEQQTEDFSEILKLDGLHYD